MKIYDGKFVKVGELCDPNTIFKLVLKKSATSKHNVQFYSPHINAWLPIYVSLEYFDNFHVRQLPISVNGNWMIENLLKWVNCVILIGYLK